MFEIVNNVFSWSFLESVLKLKKNCLNFFFNYEKYRFFFFFRFLLIIIEN